MSMCASAVVPKMSTSSKKAKAIFQLSVEDQIDGSRESRGRVAQTKPHAGELKKAIFGYKRCLLAVLGMDLDLPLRRICI